MAWQPGTAFIIKQIALFYNVAARFRKKERKEKKKGKAMIRLM